VKKILALTLTVLLVLAVLAPTAALADTTGSTGVQVATGGGATPTVMCKWEQQPIEDLEDADPTHIDPGFQITPPMVKCMTKTICYYAVVTDEEDGGAVGQAFADVYHPDNSPYPYDDSVVGGIPEGGLPYFKYEVPFTIIGHDELAQAIVTTAFEAGLITFNESENISSVNYALDKGFADVWSGCAEIDYEQPGGDYKVYTYAVDTNNNFSEPVYNEFLYVPTCGVEVDFTGIDWGSVNLGNAKQQPGDTEWDDPSGINNATVRNIGNVWAHVTVMFDDMGFGQDVNDMWNVNFGARMASDDAYKVTPIMPNVERILPNALGLSTQEELDFWITIIKGTGPHTGEITIGCEMEPFVYEIPEYVIGLPSPCAERFSD
jgi:hypothetical protein